MADNAHAIYQAHLDVLSGAVWRRDRDAVARAHDDVVDVVATDEHMRGLDRDTSVELLMGFRVAMDGIGATGYHRVCLAAAVTEPDRIDGRHMTYILRGGNYAIDPYACEMTLRLRDGTWRMSETRVNRPYLGAGGLDPLRSPTRPALPVSSTGPHPSPAARPIRRIL